MCPTVKAVRLQRKGTTVRYSKNTRIQTFFYNLEIKGMVFEKSVIQQQQN